MASEPLNLFYFLLAVDFLNKTLHIQNSNLPFHLLDLVLQTEVLLSFILGSNLGDLCVLQIVRLEKALFKLMDFGLSLIPLCYLTYKVAYYPL